MIAITQIDRRTLVRGGIAGMPMLLFPSGVHAADGEAIAETKYCRVRGSRISGVEIYRGIPYAGGVSGTLRFRSPRPSTALVRPPRRDTTRRAVNPAARRDRRCERADAVGGLPVAYRLNPRSRWQAAPGDGLHHEGDFDPYIVASDDYGKVGVT